MDIQHRFVRTNGIRMHVAELGQGPAVLLCHGFPECWYSWRHQMTALADAGFRAIAPDLRGYGQTDAPMPVDQYTLLHLLGDVIGLLDALDLPQAMIVGHDWGAPIAWHAALMRPDRIRAVAGLSVPWFPRTATRPSTAMPGANGRIFYQSWFAIEGLAEAEFDRDLRATLSHLTWLWSGDNVGASADDLTMVAEGGPMLAGRQLPATLPSWVSDADLDVYAAAFAHHGFRGPLNWYRNIDRNWELLAPWSGSRITVPAIYLVGERDLLLTFRGMDRLVPNLARFIPDLREKAIVPGCGHWIQREQAALVSEALIRLARATG